MEFGAEPRFRKPRVYGFCRIFFEYGLGGGTLLRKSADERLSPFPGRGIKLLPSQLTDSSKCR